MNLLSFAAFFMDRYVVLVAGLNLLMNPAYNGNFIFFLALFIPAGVIQATVWPRVVSRLGTMFAFRASLLLTSMVLFVFGGPPLGEYPNQIAFAILSVCRPCDPSLLLALSESSTPREFVMKARSRAAAKHAANPVAMFMFSWIVYSNYDDRSFNVFYLTAAVIYVFILVCTKWYDDSGRLEGYAEVVQREIQSMYGPNEVRPVTGDSRTWPMFLARMTAESVARTLTENLLLATIVLFGINATHSTSAFYMAFEVQVLEVFCVFILIGVTFSLAERDKNFAVQIAGAAASSLAAAVMLVRSRSGPEEAVFIMCAVPYLLLSYTSEACFVEAVRATFSATDTHVDLSRKAQYHSFYHDSSTEVITALLFACGQRFSVNILIGSLMGCAVALGALAILNYRMFRNFVTYNLVGAMGAVARSNTNPARWTNEPTLTATVTAHVAADQQTTEGLSGAGPGPVPTEEEKIQMSELRVETPDAVVTSFTIDPSDITSFEPTAAAVSVAGDAAQETDTVVHLDGVSVS